MLLRAASFSVSEMDGEKVVFADLKIGDYVVHHVHGIGQFLGVNTIKANNTIKDYIKYCELNKDKPVEFFDKTKYTETELLSWRVDFLRESLERTHLESKKIFKRLNEHKNNKLTYIMARRIYEKKIVGTKLNDSKFINKLKAKIKNKK